MSIKSALRALFGRQEPKSIAEPPAEVTVSDISKDLVTTIAKLDARTKELETKISTAEAAAAAANEVKRQAAAEQTDAFELSKKVKDIVTPLGASSRATAPAPALKVVPAAAGTTGDRARVNGGG